MTKAELEALKSAALALPESERAALAKDLVASLDGEVEDAETVAKAWDIEIYRRLDDIEAGKVELLDAEEVLARARAKLRI